MKKNVKEKSNTHKFERFEYHLEDMDCLLCLFYRGKKGCSRAVCCCLDERADAIAHGRIKRKKGWDRGCRE
jgi:hypothetical protein